MNKRISNLQILLRNQDIDVAVIMDRENLIYFLKTPEIECASLIVDAQNNETLICLSQDAPHIQKTSGTSNIVTYNFPQESIGEKTGKILASARYRGIRIGFTRYFVSIRDYLSIQKYNPDLTICDIGNLVYKIRSIKEDIEISYIRKASSFLSVGMSAAISSLTPGIIETAVLAEADYAMRRSGSEGSTFRMQVLRSDRQMMTHPYAGENRIIDGPVIIHLGASYKGYTAKLCRTVFLGKYNDQSLEIYKILHEAQSSAMKAVIPGVQASDVFYAAYDVVCRYGYSKQFLDHIGYGVGIRQSEFYPIIGRDMNILIEKNMVIDLLLPTIYDHQYGGPRITDTILVREKDCSFLTEFDREPIFIN